MYLAEQVATAGGFDGGRRAGILDQSLEVWMLADGESLSE